MMTIQILPALYYEITVFCIPSIGCIQILKAMRSCPVPMPASLKKCIARLSQSLPIPVAAHPSENVYKAVVGARVAQKYRTIPIDLFYDIERIGNIISPPSSIIGFKPDGSIYNIGSDGNPLEHNIFNESLRDILKESFSMDQES